MEEQLKLTFDTFPDELKAITLDYLLQKKFKAFVNFAFTNENNHNKCFSHIQARIKELIALFGINEVSRNYKLPSSGKKQKTVDFPLSHYVLIYKYLKKFQKIYPYVKIMAFPNKKQRRHLEQFLSECVKVAPLVESYSYGYCINFIAALVDTYLKNYGFVVAVKDYLGQRFNAIEKLQYGAEHGCVNARALLVILERSLNQPLHFSWLKKYKEMSTAHLWFYVFCSVESQAFRPNTQILFSNGEWDNALMRIFASNLELYRVFTVNLNLHTYHPVTILTYCKRVCMDEKLLNDFNAKILELFPYYSEVTGISGILNRYYHFLTVLMLKEEYFNKYTLSEILNLVCCLIENNFYQFDFLMDHQLFDRWSASNYLDLFKQVEAMHMEERSILIHCPNLILLSKNFFELKALIALLLGSDLSNYFNFTQSCLQSMERAEDNHVKIKAPMDFDFFTNGVNNLNYLISVCRSAKDLEILIQCLCEEKVKNIDEKRIFFNSRAVLSRAPSVALQNVDSSRVIVCLLWIPIRLIKCIVKSGEVIKLIKTNRELRTMLGTSRGSLNALETSDILQKIAMGDASVNSYQADQCPTTNVHH